MKQEVKNYLTGEVEEEVYAGVFTTSTTLASAEKGKIRAGYDAVIVGLAVSYDETITAFLKIKDKQYYPDGFNTIAMSDVAQAAGIGDEFPLNVALKEGDEWKLQFKSTAVTPKVNYRFRIRLFKKE